MTTQNPLQIVRRDKEGAALTSVIAAVGLTTFKILVGVLTGSLGILAEAAHSGLDLVAALVTFFAVRISGKPADKQHLYGYGKVENLSALFETLLLLVTCVWIISEAIQRLFFKSVEVENSIWSFVVMAASIAIDYSRSRVLYRAARRYNSQALEADALHFSTDIWSSSVVILGLFFVFLAGRFQGLAFLKSADSVAALGVAIIVIYVSIELGIRTVQGLLDSAPPGMAEKITEAVSALPGIVDCHNVRIRYSGSHLFVDAHVLVDGSQTLDEAHSITEVIEKTIHNIVGNADITVHPEPAQEPTVDEDTIAAITAAVEALPGVVNCHDVRVRYSGPDLIVDAHVLVDGAQTLDEVHAITEVIEGTILKIVPNADVTVHPEPAVEVVENKQTVSEITRAVESLPGVLNCHDVRIRYSGSDLFIEAHVLVDGDLPLKNAHSITDAIEETILKIVPDAKITVHPEPAPATKQ
jgi:cation diffusion facilitator family transporter